MMNSVVRIVVTVLWAVAYALVVTEISLLGRVGPDRLFEVGTGRPTPSSARLLGWLARRLASPPPPPCFAAA